MILTDQPKCFSKNVVAAVSSISDGSMLNRPLGVHAPEILVNRREFCKNIGLDYDDVVYLRIVYAENRSYHLIAEADDGATLKITPEIVTDALFTRQTGVGLLLPVADCVAAIMYDSRRKFFSTVTSR